MLKIVDRVLKQMIPDSTWKIDDPNGVYLTQIGRGNNPSAEIL